MKVWSRCKYVPQFIEHPLVCKKSTILDKGESDSGFILHHCVFAPSLVFLVFAGKTTNCQTWTEHVRCFSVFYLYTLTCTYAGGKMNQRHRGIPPMSVLVFPHSGEPVFSKQQWELPRAAASPRRGQGVSCPAGLNSFICRSLSM